MFSEETLIEMADGKLKHINTIKPGDLIINKLRNPIRVRKLEVFPNTLVVAVQLNNGTGVFYTAPNTKFLCHHIIENQHVSHFDTIQNIHTDGGYLKSSMKFFSPESDVSISNYDSSNATLTKTVYCIEPIGDSTNSYIINGVIANC
jgi:hypothetical protein